MFIRIVRRPVGEAPEWVRDAWFGLLLPTKRGSPRSWPVTGVLSGQASVFARIRDRMQGRTRRLTGYAVNAKAAVDLLAETHPAAAQWWRENAPWLLTGDRYFLFDIECCEPVDGPSPADGLPDWPRAFWRACPASTGWIALLWTIATLVRVAHVMIFPGEEMRPVSSILYLSGTPVFAAFLAIWVMRLRGAALPLVSALTSLDLAWSCITFALAFVLPGAGRDPWFVSGLYFVIIAVLIGRGLAGLTSRKRRAAAIVLVIGSYVGSAALLTTDGAFWRVSAVVRPMFGQADPADAEDNVPPAIDADLLWRAQDALVRKEISNLRPRTATMMNVYAVAVAGSGVQALFSREAHEALRVAAVHFGDGDRGGAMLSNGAVDFMQTPLATRDNIAAIARGIGDKADHRRDLLFLYLTSHGSRTAELMSALPGYQTVQPISSVSTAEALHASGVARRVIVISACFAASWIPALADDNTIVITAAAKDRTSFGCDDSRRMTLFGETFLGSLAIKGISLHDAFEDAKRKISLEETRQNITASLPQAFVGRNMQALWMRNPQGTSARQP